MMRADAGGRRCLWKCLTHWIRWCIRGSENYVITFLAIMSSSSTRFSILCHSFIKLFKTDKQIFEDWLDIYRSREFNMKKVGSGKSEKWNKLSGIFLRRLRKNLTICLRLSCLIKMNSLFLIPSSYQQRQKRKERKEKRIKLKSERKISDLKLPLWSRLIFFNGTISKGNDRELKMDFFIIFILFFLFLELWWLCSLKLREKSISQCFLYFLNFFIVELVLIFLNDDSEGGWGRIWISLETIFISCDGWINDISWKMFNVFVAWQRIL